VLSGIPGVSALTLKMCVSCVLPELYKPGGFTQNCISGRKMAIIYSDELWLHWEPGIIQFFLF